MPASGSRSLDLADEHKRCEPPLRRRYSQWKYAMAVPPRRADSDPRPGGANAHHPDHLNLALLSPFPLDLNCSGLIGGSNS